MPSEPVAFRLGPVALDYAPFRWPLYRGTGSRRVTIRQGAKKMAALNELPATTTLTLTDPAGERVDIPVDLVSVEPVGSVACDVTLADRRFRLERHYLPHDVNIRWGNASVVKETGEVSVEQRYVSESAHLVKTAKGDGEASEAPVPATVAQAIDRIKEIATDQYPGVSLFDSFELGENAADDAVSVVADNTLVGGQSFSDALRNILAPAGLDLTVTVAGVLKIVSRKKTPGQDGLLGAVRWIEQRPPWEAMPGKRFDAPEKVVTPVIRREQFRATFASGNITYSPPIGPHWRLRQRYQSIFGSGWLDLAGMLREVNDSLGVIGGGFTISDAQIARHIYTGNWAGTELWQERQTRALVGGVSEGDRITAARRLITSIDSSWRKHFKLVVEAGSQGEIPQAPESDGYFWDIQFGTLRADPNADEDLSAVGGTVRPQAVRGPWVELFRSAQIPEGAQDPKITDLFYSQNNGSSASEAPFTVRWLDPAERVIEVVPLTNRLVIDRRLGALTRQDTVTEAPASVKASVSAADREFVGDLMIRRRDITSKADGRIEYSPSLQFDVSIVAKSRAPLSDRARFHEIETESEIEGATGTVYLDVDPDAVADISPDDESVLNESAINEHARKRVDEFLAPMRDPKRGNHAGQGVGAALRVPVDGTVSAVTLECGDRGLATVVSRVEVGIDA